MNTAQLYQYFSQELGKEAEQEVYYALTWLRGQGEIFDFYQTEPNSREDSAGIDFVIFATKYWLPIPLQVKRSKCTVKEHRKKYPHIPVVVVQNGKVMTQIRRQIDKVLCTRRQIRANGQFRSFAESQIRTIGAIILDN